MAEPSPRPKTRYVLTRCRPGYQIYVNYGRPGDGWTAFGSPFWTIDHAWPTVLALNLSSEIRSAINAHPVSPEFVELEDLA